ncbi:MAG: N-acetyltransferase [Candidatus Altiarchaeales archaeon HGW-Altiarchaeales-3]|nr:MAG: N-acetyltransferase [Candidatus Altiarchaeales archaeon HGW-Altiarchaeales-3]
MTSIHKTAEVSKEAKIGKGTGIWHQAQVRENAEIGENCNIGKGVYVDFGVKIGNNCKIQNYVSIYHGVEIEDDVFIGPSVTFTNDLYPRAFIWNEEKVSRTRVKKGASIGANSTIICGITIGEYAMIGAGSVVTKDVPDNALVYGNPAKIKGCVSKDGRIIK